MYDYHGKFVCSETAARGLLMNKITDSTCNDVADFTDNDNFQTHLNLT